MSSENPHFTSRKETSPGLTEETAQLESEDKVNHQELLGAAALLRHPRYFATPTGGDPLTQGREIFLVAAGKKPGAIVTNTYPIFRFRSRDRIDADATAWLRDSFGIAAVPQKSTYGGSFYIAKSDPVELQAEVEYIEGLKGPDREVATGKFLGYPRSAVNAFAYENGKYSLPVKDQQRILAENGLPHKDLFFRFSEDAWEAELEEYKRWYTLLDEYGLGKNK